MIATGSADISQQNYLSICRDNKLDISVSQLRLLEEYVSLLLSHNKNINLISRKDEQNIWTQHILHCTTLLFYRKFPPNANILDLGTGGGLPGIVYAIFHPELHFTLLDSTRKKIDAVQSMAGELGLKNVSTVRGRAEEIGKQPEYSGKFDIVVSRAVAQLDKLVKWSKPFLSCKSSNPSTTTRTIPGCSLISFKGGDIDREVSRVEKDKQVQHIESILLDPIDDKKVLIIRFS